MTVTELINYLDQITEPDTTEVLLLDADALTYEGENDFVTLEYVFQDYRPEEAGFEEAT